MFHKACFVVAVFGDEEMLHKLTAKEHSNLGVERSLLVICHSWMPRWNQAQPSSCFQPYQRTDTFIRWDGSHWNHKSPLQWEMLSNSNVRYWNVFYHITKVPMYLKMKYQFLLTSKWKLLQLILSLKHWILVTIPAFCHFTPTLTSYYKWHSYVLMLIFYHWLLCPIR